LQFWQGAVTGLIVSGLNHAMHMGDDGPGDPPKKKKITWDTNGDGILQKSEADNWYMTAKGKGITINGNRIDLTGLTRSDMTFNADTNTFALATTAAFSALPYQTAATFGGSTFRLVNGRWQMLSQRYHYRTREWNSFENGGRNLLTIIGSPDNVLRPSEINSINGRVTAIGKQFMINIRY
jgi:hypothetical protein